MSVKRFPLASLSAAGGTIRSWGVAPRRLLIVLGLAAIGVGLVILHLARAEAQEHETILTVVGLVFAVVGVLHLTFKASFMLDTERKMWREVIGFPLLAKVKTGSFDDALGLEILTWEVQDSTLHSVIWRWRDPDRPARILSCSRDYSSAHSNWITLGRELGLPLVEKLPSGVKLSKPEEVETRAGARVGLRNIASLSLPPAPPKVDVRIERSDRRILMLMPRYSLWWGLSSLLLLGAILEIMALFLLLVMHFLYCQQINAVMMATMLGMSPVFLGLVGGVMIVVWFLARQRVDLTDEAILFGRLLGYAFSREKRIAYTDIVSVEDLHVVGMDETMLILRTAKRSYVVGQTLTNEGRQWLVAALRAFLELPPSV